MKTLASDMATQRFNRLANEWKKQTSHLSSISQMVMHPSYQQIIGMGDAVVPLLLKSLEKEPDHWFWALTSITGENPVPLDQRGKIKEMAHSWVKWGKEKGYC